MSQSPPNATPTQNLAITLIEQAEDLVAETWQGRIVSRMASQINKELRDGLAAPAPTSEQQALGIIKGTAADLRAASQSLFKAAEELKRAGRGLQASQAHQAARRAADAAEALIGA